MWKAINKAIGRSKNKNLDRIIELGDGKIVNTHNKWLMQSIIYLNGGSSGAATCLSHFLISHHRAHSFYVVLVDVKEVLYNNLTVRDGMRSSCTTKGAAVIAPLPTHIINFRMPFSR